MKNIAFKILFHVISSLLKYYFIFNDEALSACKPRRGSFGHTVPNIKCDDIPSVGQHKDMPEKKRIFVKKLKKFEWLSIALAA